MRKIKVFINFLFVLLVAFTLFQLTFNIAHAAALEYTIQGSNLTIEEPGDTGCDEPFNVYAIKIGETNWTKLLGQNGDADIEYGESIDLNQYFDLGDKGKLSVVVFCDSDKYEVIKDYTADDESAECTVDITVDGGLNKDIVVWWKCNDNNTGKCTASSWDVSIDSGSFNKSKDDCSPELDCKFPDTQNSSYAGLSVDVQVSNGMGCEGDKVYSIGSRGEEPLTVSVSDVRDKDNGTYDATVSASSTDTDLAGMSENNDFFYYTVENNGTTIFEGSVGLNNGVFPYASDLVELYNLKFNTLYKITFNAAYNGTNYTGETNLLVPSINASYAGGSAGGSSWILEYIEKIRSVIRKNFNFNISNVEKAFNLLVNKIHELGSPTQIYDWVNSNEGIIQCFRIFLSESGESFPVAYIYDPVSKILSSLGEMYNLVKGDLIIIFQSDLSDITLKVIVTGDNNKKEVVYYNSGTLPVNNKLCSLVEKQYPDLDQSLYKIEIKDFRTWLRSNTKKIKHIRSGEIEILVKGIKKKVVEFNGI